MADAPGADRNLLFGILALQMNFIGRDVLIAAMNEWVLDKARPLGQILADQRQLSPGQLRGLDELIALHLAAHDGDPSRSLQAVASVASVASMLAPLTDPDIQGSVLTIASNDNSSTGYYQPPSDVHGPRYVKLRHHAAGGLGNVFVAEDVELHREVALKEIKKERADDAASRARFVLEAEVTGGLEHPGVVPVYGLGVFKDGRPYYAMRFIRGESLKAAIDRFHRGPSKSASERRLTLRELLTRFVAVCNAVAYAHSRGVLHRDIKPANIMLGPYGETLVVDWGLAKTRAAKAPAPAADEPTLMPASGSISDETRAGSRLGTAQFMSPEQDAGRVDELGPTSDIYSLGVTLYVLLTGKRPYEAVSNDELSEAVQTGRFPPPRTVNPAVPRPLDAICVKAMALRPAGRYDTALALAADIEHWLADEPVAAYAEPLPGRAMRWGRRHRTAVASAAVLLVAAVVALSITNGLVLRAERKTEEQKRIAEANYGLARALSVSSVDLIVSNEAKYAADPTMHKARKVVLTAAAAAYRKYLDEEPNNPAMQVRAALVFRYAANVHRLEHDVAAAEPLYRDALALYEGVKGSGVDEVMRRDNLAGTLRDHAAFQANVGKLKDAAASLEGSLQIARELRQEGPEESGGQLLEAAALLSRAGLEHTRGDYAAAEATATQSVALFRGLEEKVGPYIRPLLAAALNIVAVTRRDNATIAAATRDTAAKLSRAFGGTPAAWADALRIVGARKLHTESIELIDKLVKEKQQGINPEDLFYFRASFRIEQAKTMAKVSAKRAVDADKNLGLAAGEMERQMQLFPEIPMYRTGMAKALLERGELRAAGGRAAAAHDDFRRVVELLEKPAEAEIPPAGTLSILGRAQFGLARLARAKGDAGSAKSSFESAETILRRATNLSPDDAEDRRSLNAVLAEKR